MFEEDFQTERRDRERAAGEYDESRCLLEKEIEELSSQLQLEKKQKEKLAYEIHRMKEVSKTPNDEIVKRYKSYIHECLLFLHREKDVRGFRQKFWVHSQGNLQRYNNFILIIVQVIAL